MIIHSKMNEPSVVRRNEALTSGSLIASPDFVPKQNVTWSMAEILCFFVVSDSHVASETLFEPSIPASKQTLGSILRLNTTDHVPSAKK